ncbi:MAG: hypothetical protein JW821_07225 [Deltaproteobacteria bacterium]|nr:hypothetical protein [Deltaproteobacteria bacterium]
MLISRCAFSAVSYQCSAIKSRTIPGGGCRKTPVYPAIDDVDVFRLRWKGRSAHSRLETEALPYPSPFLFRDPTQVSTLTTTLLPPILLDSSPGFLYI